MSDKLFGGIATMWRKDTGECGTRQETYEQEQVGTGERQKPPP